jgi:hypothetical protein
MNEMIIEFRGLIFEGFKFKRSNKYSESYFDKLLLKDNHYNRVKYKDAIIEQVDEQIHIKLSQSFIAAITSYGCIAVSLILLLNHFLIPSFVVLAIGFISHLLFSYTKRRANEYFAGKQMCMDMVDVIYEMQ